MSLLSIFSFTASLPSLAFKRRKAPTGHDQAKRFVEVVTTEAKDHRFVSCQRLPIHRGHHKYLGGWSWMANEEWRNEVLRLLKDQPVRRCEFIGPDGHGDWTFDCVSTYNIPLVATLTLDDSY